MKYFKVVEDKFCSNCEGQTTQGMENCTECEGEGFTMVEKLISLKDLLKFLRETLVKPS